MPPSIDALDAAQPMVDEEVVATPRSRPSTIPPSLDADLRLMRAAMDQQSQLLSVLHQTLVMNQVRMDARMQALVVEVNAQTEKIDNITELLSAISKHRDH